VFPRNAGLLPFDGQTNNAVRRGERVWWPVSKRWGHQPFWPLNMEQCSDRLSETILVPRSNNNFGRYWYKI